jgi:rubrerythrin
MASLREPRIHFARAEGFPIDDACSGRRDRENTMTIAKLVPAEREIRRSFLSGFGKFTLSATAIALLAGNEKLALITPASAKTANDDVAILNSALGAEQQAIAAYQLGADSGLLQKPVLALAVQFQGHHKQHADALAKAVQKLGGKPATPLKDYGFQKDKLKSEADVLSFAATLEKGAVSAYLGAVPILTDRELAKAAASILGDEAMHWAVLRQALGQTPVPEAFVS